MEAVIAEGWHDSMFGEAGLEQLRRRDKELDAAFAEREAAQKAFDADPSPANAAKLAKAKARYDAAAAEYRDLSHEFDAERLEAKVKEKF